MSKRSQSSVLIPRTLWCVTHLIEDEYLEIGFGMTNPAATVPRRDGRVAPDMKRQMHSLDSLPYSSRPLTNETMNEELQDEVTSINSIYGDKTLRSVSSHPVTLALTIPQHPSISIQIEFSENYPDVPPSVLGPYSVGDDVAKGAGTRIVELLRIVLAEVYAPKQPCIFDLVEEAGARLQQLGLGEGTEGEEPQSAQEDGQQSASLHQIGSDHHQPAEVTGEEPPWAISEVVSEKKSVFVARAAAVYSVEQGKGYLAHLLATDKKVAKATHNITAWRIHGENGVQFQDCNDDGESAAGGRVLHLLELMGVWNVMVVVTR